MLGEKIGEFQAKVNFKVLPAHGSSPIIETTAEGAGSILGSNATVMVTYSTEVRPDGTLYGECPNQGVIMTQEGEMATFTAAGAGKFTGQGGAASFRGAVYFQSTSSKLAALNGTAVVYEWDVDADGNGAWNLWEWK